jgi:Ca2+-binding RTX toxin-like protein
MGNGDETKLYWALLLGLLALLLTIPAQARPAFRCTITGTPGPDVLLGTSGRDVICGLGGDDLISGGLGDDVVLGGPGRDRLDGGAGSDVIDGGPGDDRIWAWDGTADRVDGGTGSDFGRWDRLLDTVRRVERKP